MAGGPGHRHALRARGRGPVVLDPRRPGVPRSGGVSNPDAPVDGARLRTGRLARLQAEMNTRGVEACLLFNDPNIRYATGTSAMPIWSNTTFVRCALVPAEGRPILFDYPNAVHLFRGIKAELDVRPMHAWEFYDDTEHRAAVFARQTVDALRELGVSTNRLAVDRLGTPGFLALQREGIA